ncbi:MAG: dienelactone hydrolase family protein [Acidobacteria bacterium]|nr:dienelactone hydrolase family protein [Acidobacteriota bacterium]
MDRRDFLQGLLGRMIALVGGYPLASHLSRSASWAAATLSEFSETEGRSAGAGPIKYPGAGATLEGYLAKPQSEGPHPALLLIHADSGLDEHIRDVARRYAEEGFVTLAVDQLSRHGGTASFASPDAARKNIEALTSEQVTADLDAAFAYLQSNPSVRHDRIGIMGCAWGGRMAFLYAASNPELKAAVVFYGVAPPEDSVAAVTCPVLAHYGETDTRMSLKMPETAALMKQYGKSFHPKNYSAAGSGFFNDTSPASDDAAKEAWQRTIRFLRKNLG